MAPPSREYIYGINPVFEVVRGGRRKIYEAYLNQATRQHPRLQKLAAFLEQRSIPVQLVDKQRLFELSRSKEHQGAVLKVTPYPYLPFETFLSQPRLLLLDNVEDPTNVGGILRSAEIFGFHHVCLPTKGTPSIYPSVVKVSAGASEHLQVCHDKRANFYLKAALEAGYTVVALDGKGKTDLGQLTVPAGDRLLLVIGGEDKSVGQFILHAAHHVARIPMQGRVNSLNASVAAGIAMYRLGHVDQKEIL
jgi:23S rRNA (guanosine2251-2'-O)-methyltransferase